MWNPNQSQQGRLFNSGGQAGRGLIALVAVGAVVLIFYYASSFKQMDDLAQQLEQANKLVTDLEQNLAFPRTQAQTTPVSASAVFTPTDEQSEKALIKNVRSGQHDGFFRVVLEFTNAQGRSLGLLPQNNAQSNPDAQQVVLEINGLAQQQQNQLANTNFNSSLVRSLTSAGPVDPSGLGRYIFQLSGNAEFSASSLVEPARLVLDFTE